MPLCVFCPEKVMSTEILGVGLVVIPLVYSSQLFTLLALRVFFLLPFWEKTIFNKCSQSYLVLKIQNSRSHFKSVFLRLSYSSAYDDPGKAFSHLLL